MELREFEAYTLLLEDPAECGTYLTCRVPREKDLPHEAVKDITIRLEWTKT